MERVTSALKRRSAETESVHGIHSVRVRSTETGLVVNYHCKVDAAISVAEMHDFVDRVDRAAREVYPRLCVWLDTPSLQNHSLSLHDDNWQDFPLSIHPALGT